MTQPPPWWVLVRDIPRVRNVFVSYQHSTDQTYYDTFSATFSGTYGLVRDNSLRGAVDSDNSEYIIRKIREDYLSRTSCTIVLCGMTTRWRRFVDWEIKATLDKEHGLIGVLLPTNPVIFGGTHKPERLQDNIDSGYAVWTTWDELVAGGGARLRLLVELAIARSPTLIENGRDLRERSFGGPSLGPPPAAPPPLPPPPDNSAMSSLAEALLKGYQSGRLSNLRLDPPPGSLASMLAERMSPDRGGNAYLSDLMRQRYRDEYDQLFGRPMTIQSMLERDTWVRMKMGE